MKLAIIEHKTTSEDIGQGSTYWRRLTLDPQISLYFNSARELGYDVQDVLYDVLRKPAIRPSEIPLRDDDGVKIVVDAVSGERLKTKDGKKWRESAGEGMTLKTRPETPEEFEQRCLDVIKANPEKYFQRGTIVRLEDDAREAQVDIWQTAIAIRDARRLNVWPRNPDQCMQWSRTCDYLSVCAKEANIEDPYLFEAKPVHEELESNERQLLTQSSMRCYRACPRRYFYRYELGMRSIRLAAQPLRTGKSVHGALEDLWKGKSLEQALAVLDPSDLYERARAAAMLVAYVAYWGPPPTAVVVEKQFRLPLYNPDTGATSRTFEVGGMLDAIAEVES